MESGTGKRRDVEVAPPSFETPEEFFAYAQRRVDPQKFLDDFVQALRGVKPSCPPQYRRGLPAAGTARVDAGVEAISIGDKGLIRDSELFKTIFHEEMHLRLMVQARRGHRRALELVTHPDTAVEEAYAERGAVRYFEWYRKHFPFQH